MPRQKSTTPKEKKDRTGKVYKITSPSGKIYIGSTVQDIDKRWICYKNVRCYGQIKMLRSLKKYGSDTHIFEIIWQGDPSQRLKYERIYGELFQVLDRDKGLNLKLPGYEDVPAVYSEEAKAKMSISRKLVPSTVTKKCQDASVEFRSLPVNSYNLDGKFINKHKSMKQASRDTGVHPAQIRLCCVDAAWSSKGYQFRFSKGECKDDIPRYVKNPNAKMKGVNMYNADGEYIRDFVSVTEASNFIGTTTVVVYKSCKGNGKLTTFGFRFKLK